MKHKVKLLLALPLSINLLLSPSTSIALQNDFASPTKTWNTIQSADHSGEQKLLPINNNKDNEQIYLYWMAPGAKSQIQVHAKMDEVTIVQGSLYWLNADNSLQKILQVGDYVDRKAGVKHGPFKAGPDGCLMYVRFH